MKITRYNLNNFFSLLEMATFKHARKVVDTETVEDTYTVSDSGKKTDNYCPRNDRDDSRTDTCDNDNNCTNQGTCYWPIFIFIILFIIILIVCFCSGWDHRSQCGGFGGGTAIAGVFLFFIIWILLLWFFCRSGNMTAAWFFLILIFAIIFVWWIASLLANLGCNRC